MRRIRRYDSEVNAGLQSDWHGGITACGERPGGISSEPAYITAMRIAAICHRGIMGMAKCSPEPQKARYTLDDYVANPDAMDAKLKKCAKIPCAPEADPARR
jgi:hypothetical protein